MRERVMWDWAPELGKTLACAGNRKEAECLKCIELGQHKGTGVR